MQALTGCGRLRAIGETKTNRWRRTALRSVRSAAARAKRRDQHFVRITSHGAIGLNRADIGSAGITFVALFSVWTLRALRAGLSLRSKSALYTLSARPVPAVLGSLPGSLPQPARAKTRLTATKNPNARPAIDDRRLQAVRIQMARGSGAVCYAES